METLQWVLVDLACLMAATGAWLVWCANRDARRALATPDALEDSLKSWHRPGYVELAALKSQVHVLAEQVDTVTDAMGPSVGWEDEGEEWKAS